jgi:hypothetical protein
MGKTGAHKKEEDIKYEMPQSESISRLLAAFEDRDAENP